MVCNLNEHAACLIIDIKGILKITLLLDIPGSFFIINKNVNVFLM